MSDDPRGPQPAPGDEANPLAMLAGDEPRPAKPKPAKAPKPAAQGAAPGKAAAPKRAAKGATRKKVASGAPPGGPPAGTGEVAAANRPPVGGEGSPMEASLLGVAMIVIAVVIGAFLLAKGYETEGELVSGTSPTTVASVSTTVPTGLTTTSTTATTSTTSDARDPADVTVRVANAQDPSLPLASSGTTKLQAEGYKTVAGVDAPLQTESNVFYEPGYEAEALAIAKLFDIDEANVEEMPASPPVDPGGANVLVIRGPGQTVG